MISVYGTITTEDELFARTIRTVHLICSRQLSLCDMYSLLELQSANGLVMSFDHASSAGLEDGGVLTWLLCGALVFQEQQRERARSPLMTSLFPDGVPFGFMGDGSTDRSMIEQEAVVLRFLDDAGMPYNTFFELATLDLSQSADGRSPDASCIAACYSTSLDKLNAHDGFIHKSDWKKAAVGVSFDGASVMQGAQNGSAKKLSDLVEMSLVVIHAVAHVEQLGNADAFKSLPYYETWQQITQQLYVEYAQSGKKRFSLQEAAKETGITLLKISTTHGIRWASSQRVTVKAMVTDLPAVVVDLECTVKAALGLEYTQITPSNSFINKSFTQIFRETDQTRPSRWKATVKSFTPSATGLTASDSFVIAYSNRTQLLMSKAELVAALTDLNDPRLMEDSRWQLRSKLTDWRFNGFSSFMLDVHEPLAILSKSFQSNALIVFDISKHINKSLRALEKLKSLPGIAESLFLSAVSENNNADVLGTCQLYEGKEGRILLKADRLDIIEALVEHLTARFQKVLDNPILRAMSVFDHRKWPTDNEILKASYVEEIKLLFCNYKVFFDSTTTEAEVLEQWDDVKNEINQSPGLLSRKFNALWAHMLVHFLDEYPLVLRLVAIALLIPVDTSECERVFSLMNDLKTAERGSLGQVTMNHLMLWHSQAKDITCEKLPVMAILKEFRKLAGIRGRNAHRPTNPPKYNYMVEK